VVKSVSALVQWAAQIKAENNLYIHPREGWIKASSSGRLQPPSSRDFHKYDGQSHKRGCNPWYKTRGIQTHLYEQILAKKRYGDLKRR